MRYDDAANAGSMTADTAPVARPDLDALAPGSYGPASGNAITGSGTVTGSAGADTVGDAPGKIVEVHGAGGATTASGDAFQAAGQYGQLSIDAQGNFNYVRNPGTPDGVQDVFGYTLADADGATSATTLTIDIGQVAQAAAAAADAGIVTLPPGVEMSDIHVNGRDLVINMPDGTQMVIPGGAVFVPNLVIGDVAVPPSNLAALLIDSEPKPAAGELQSSGGNFAVDVPPLDPGVPLGDLIPPTELGYRPPDFEEVNQFEDEEPTVVIQTPDNPAGAVAAVDQVDESGLHERTIGGVLEPEGSHEPQSIETTTGTIVFEAADGLDSITIEGADGAIEIGSGDVGTVIHGLRGDLTITSVNLANGQVGYTYTVTDNTAQGVDDFDDFTVRVIDDDGDVATATLHINIIDDVPTANDDTDVLNSDGIHATGNVLTGANTTSGSAGADVVGADNASITALSGAGGNDSTIASNLLEVDGQFGHLVLNTVDGSYTYTRFDNALGGGNDVFTYTLHDGDGDNDTATLTIAVPNVQPPIGGNVLSLTVDDEALPGGTNPGSTDEVDSGSLSFTAGGNALTSFAFSTDLSSLGGGLTWVRISATEIQGWDGGVGSGTKIVTLTLNAPGSIAAGASGSVTVTATLNDNYDSHPGINVDDLQALGSVKVVATDSAGLSATDTVSVGVSDDIPEAANDGNLASLDDGASGVTIGTVAGLLGNDEYGADGPASSGALVIATGSLGGTISVVGGNLVYTSNHNVAPGDSDTETFTYTIKDGDGDTATATFTVTLTDDGPSIDRVSASISVDEEGLGGNPGTVYGDGSDLAGTDTTQSGTLSGLDFGGDGPGDIVLAAAADTGLRTLSGAVVASSWDASTHTLTGFADANNNGSKDAGEAAVFTLQITNVSTGAYTFTLLQPVKHDTADTEDNATFNVGVTVTDSEGDPATSSINILIDDDSPVANDDGNLATVDDNASGVTIGTLAGLLANDSPGADGASPGAVVIGTGSLGGTISISGGNLVYTSAHNTIPGETDTETFTYTITDNDGDTDTATFTVKLTDEGPKIDQAAASIAVDEEGLTGGNAGTVYGDGSDLAGTATTQSGTLAGLDFGGDGPGDIVLTAVADTGLRTLSGAVVKSAWNGSNHTLTGFVDTNGNGAVDAGETQVFTLQITNVSTGAYTFTLLQPVKHSDANTEDNATFNVGVTVTDAEGDPASGSISVLIDDDSPVANDDGNLATIDDNSAGVIIGTVAGLLGNDSYGADGAASTGAIVIATGSLGGTISIVAGNLVYTSNHNTAPGATDTETFTYTIKDGDGDTETATFTVKLTDEGPKIDQAAATIAVDEEGLTGGNAGTVYGDGSDLAGTATTQSGTLSGLDFGSDGPGNIVLTAVADTGLRTLSGGVVKSVWNNSNHTLTGFVDTNGNGAVDAGETQVFTLQITNVSTGAYTFTLLQPVKHATANTEDNATFNVGVTVTDSEGDPASGSISVLIDDDSPVANDDGNLATIDDSSSGVTIGTVAGLLGNDSYGADGAASSGAIVIGVGSLGGTISIVGGNLVYTSNHDTAPGNTDTETFTYTIKDGDGDTETATFTVKLSDGGPSIDQTAASIAVDEEGLTGGNPGTTYGDGSDLAGIATTQSGTLSGLSFGTDGPGDIVLTAVADTGLRTLSGAVVKSAWNGSNHTLTGFVDTNGNGAVDAGETQVFTLQITNVSTGAYTFTLLQPVKHVTANTEDNATFSVGVTVTDSEGDPASGSINVLIDDDSPVAVGDGNLATIDDNSAGVTIGTVAGILGNDSYGADGAATSGAIVIGTGSLGGTIAISGGNLVYTSNHNTAPGNTDTETFTYTIKDGDGDTTTATFTVKLTDTGPSINQAAASIAVDEEGLTGGNPGTVYGDGSDLAGTATTQSGTLAGLSFGTDGPGNIVLTAVADTGLRTLSGAVVKSAWNGTTHTLTGFVDTNGNGAVDAGETQVFTLQITNVSTGAYTFTLLQPVKHSDANTEDNATFNVGVTVTDAEGDPASGSISVLIDDDSPVAVGDGNLATVDDNSAGVTIGTVAGILGNDSYGADGAAASGAIVIGVGSLGGTIAISAGNLVYTSNHNTAPGNTDTETFTYTIKDGDGDTTTATFTVKLTDGGPSINQAAASIAVDEEGLSGGIAGVIYGDGSDLAGESATQSGTLAGLSFGPDGPGNIVLTAVADTGLRTLSGGVVKSAWNGTTHTLTGFVDTNGNGAVDAGETQVFTLQITNVSTGAYTFTLLQPVKHTAVNTEDNATFNVGVTVTDAEGDPATGSISVLIDDDSPINFVPDDANAENTGTDIVTGKLDTDDLITNNAGADGVKSVTWNVVDGTTLFDSDGNPVKVGGLTVKLYVEANGTLTATTDHSQASATVFTGTLDAATSSYSIDFDKALDNGSTSASDFSAAAAGNTPWKGIDPDLVNGSAVDIASPLDPNPDSVDLLLSPIGAATINTDSDDIGTGGGQKVNPDEALRIDLVQDLRRDPGQSESDAGGYLYDDHVGQKVFTFKLVDIQGNAATTSVVRIDAFNVTDGATAQSNVGDPSINTAVDIDPASIVVRDSAGNIRTSGITVVESGTGVYVNGILQGDTVTFQATGGATFEAVTIADASNDANPNGGTFSGAAFGVGGFAYGQNDAGHTVSFQLPVLLTDGDGDTSTGSIHVNVGPVGSSSSLAAASTLSVEDSSTSSLSLLSSNDNTTQQKSLSTDTMVLSAALAAAGLASEPLAASTPDADGGKGGSHNVSVAKAHTAPMQSDAGERHVERAAANDPQSARDEQADSPARHGADHAQSEAQNISAEPKAPTELLQGTDAPSHGNAGAATAVTAASIVMPAAEQLMEAGKGGAEGKPESVDGADHAQHNQVVGKVLADALNGGHGHGPDIEALVNGLPGHGEHGGRGAHALASHGQAAVPNGDTADFALFTASHGMHGMDHMAMHQDAAPAHG